MAEERMSSKEYGTYSEVNFKYKKGGSSQTRRKLDLPPPRSSLKDLSQERERSKHTSRNDDKHVTFQNNKKGATMLHITSNKPMQSIAKSLISDKTTDHQSMT